MSQSVEQVEQPKQVVEQPKQVVEQPKQVVEQAEQAEQSVEQVSEQSVEQVVEQSVEQVVEQSVEQVVEQSVEQVVEQEAKQIELKYVLTDEEQSYIRYYVRGWSKVWNNEYARQYGGRWVGRSNVFHLAVGLLASGEELLNKNTNYCKTILYGLYKGGWLKHASIVITNEHDFMYRNYRFYYNTFDRTNRVARFEEKTILNIASPWTIVKAFRSQLLASVDSLYSKNRGGLRLTEYKVETKTNKNVNKENTRTLEEACYRGAIGEELIHTLYGLLDTHNTVLKSTINLGEYYKYANTLRTTKKRVYIKHNNTYRNNKNRQPSRVKVDNQKKETGNTINIVKDDNRKDDKLKDHIKTEINQRR